MSKNKEKTYDILINDGKHGWETIEYDVKDDTLNYLLSEYKMAYPKNFKFKIIETMED